MPVGNGEYGRDKDVQGAILGPSFEGRREPGRYLPYVERIKWASHWERAVVAVAAVQGYFER